MTESLIARLCFSKTKNSFPKEGWKKGNQNLPFFHSLPLPLAQDSLHLQNNTVMPRNSPQKHSWDKMVFCFFCYKDFTSPFWPWLLSRYCNGKSLRVPFQTRWSWPFPWDPDSWPWPQTFWLVTLSDLSNLLESRTSSVWPPSLVSLPHPSLSGIMVLLLI